jgi:hypothetical protein
MERSAARNVLYFTKCQSITYSQGEGHGLCNPVQQVPALHSQSGA